MAVSFAAGLSYADIMGRTVTFEQAWFAT